MSNAAAPCILVVDDEPELREMLSEYLGGKGYTVITAAHSAAAREALQLHPIRLAIVDIQMPGEDGLSLARHLREHLDIAIIMLTAANDVLDRVIGLEVGADDYLAKPFDLRELLARMRSLLRRFNPESAPAAPDGWATFGHCRLDLEAQALFGEDGREIPLTTLEFALLKVFHDHPNRVLSRDEILTLTDSSDGDPFDRSVDIRVARLRRKIERTPDKPEFIRTIRGAGYLYARPRT